MHVHLVLPGLLWPGALAPDPTAELALDALQSLLGFAQQRTAAALSPDAWLLQHFGQPADSALAVLRRAGEADAESAPLGDASRVLCADPGHVRFAREHMILTDATNLDIHADEAAALITSLNEEYGDLGTFCAPHPDRWYLHTREAVHSRFVPLATAVGRPLAQFIDADDEARRWQRMLSELQITLHHHPVNQAREAGGRPTINTLWLWGTGVQPDDRHNASQTVFSATPLVRGLARTTGAPLGQAMSFADLPWTEAGTCLVYLDALLWPALHLDLQGWRDALQTLEHTWFAPLLAELRARHVNSVRITAPSEIATLDFHLTPRQLWRFWRRPRHLRDCYPTLPPAPTTTP